VLGNVDGQDIFAKDVGQDLWETCGRARSVNFVCAKNATIDAEKDMVQVSFLWGFL
jgi:hypothetical protein